MPKNKTPANMTPGIIPGKKTPQDWDKTIFALSQMSPLKQMVIERNTCDDLTATAPVEQQRFKIRLAHSDERVSSANMLVERMYTRKGYGVPGMQKMPDRITFMASQNEVVIGTVTLRFDTDKGLLADQSNKEVVDQLRAENRRVCELTTFAVDETRGTKRVLATLFHIAYIYGRVLQKQTDVVIEVTPKHALFYKRMLGFKQLGEEHLILRTNARAVLLRLEIEYVDQQITRWGGQADQAQGERSLYPYFFSKEDEAGITQRLLSGE